MKPPPKAAAPPTAASPTPASPVPVPSGRYLEGGEDQTSIGRENKNTCPPLPELVALGAFLGEPFSLR